MTRLPKLLDRYRAAQSGAAPPIFDHTATCLDVTGAGAIEIQISTDGTVLWVNGESLLLRVCGIRGAIQIIDLRKPHD